MNDPLTFCTAVFLIGIRRIQLSAAFSVMEINIIRIQIDV